MIPEQTIPAYSPGVHMKSVQAAPVHCIHHRKRHDMGLSARSRPQEASLYIPIEPQNPQD
jgi:hypothetical protein